MRRIFVSALTILALVAPAVAAQSTGAAAGSQSSMSAEHHAMSMWKEMDAFHALLAATWHPAEKNDLAPLKSKVKDLAKAAETWSGSKAPAMAHGCGTEAVTKTAAKVATDARALATMVESGAEDMRLKDSLKALHDTFEVAEKACGGHGGHP